MSTIESTSVPAASAEAGYSFALKRTPWGTPWYGNFGGEILRSTNGQLPAGGLPLADAEQVRADMVSGLETQWRNGGENRGALGASDIYEVVPWRASAPAGIAVAAEVPAVHDAA